MMQLAFSLRFLLPAIELNNFNGKIFTSQSVQPPVMRHGPAEILIVAEHPENSVKIKFEG